MSLGITDLKMAAEESSPTRHVCDPQGDILLILDCGTELRELQVSSSTLSLASRVFKAMFRGYFKEAQDLGKKPEPTGLLRIDLSEDNFEGMLFLCGLFHFNHGVYFGKPYDSEAILNLAIVCDKYDCS